MKNAWLSTHDLQRHYHRAGHVVRALDGVDLEVDRGEFLAVVGASGSGKSTLLNLLAGLDTPTAGEIRVEDRPLQSLGRRDLARYRAHRVGIVFQTFNLLAHLTALRNVELALTFAGMPRPARREKALAVLSRLGLGERLHHRPPDLSGGEQQRVAMARALVKEPDLLLADEPTGNLDRDNAEMIAATLVDCHRRGLTVIMVTHDEELAARLTPRRVRMDYGKLRGGVAMIPADMLDISLENLRRHKLRVFFTTAGVVIAIATFVALLSFAAGSQRWVNEGFRELGLLTRMNVYPRDAEDTALTAASSDSERAAVLDTAAIRALQRVPGVRFAYPFVDFQVTAAVADTQVTARARALAPDAFATGLFRTVLDGHAFSAPTAREAIVTREFAEQIAVATPESLLGRSLVIAMEVASLDSALLNVVGKNGEALGERLRSVRLDSLRDPAARRRLLRRELSEGLRRFVTGFFAHQTTVADTLTIVGVGADLPRYSIRLAPIIIPEATGRRLSSVGFALGQDPATLLAALRGGTLFAPADAESGANYPQVTLELERFASHAAVKDSVESLGFRAFSYAEQFEEIQRFHYYFYAALGVVGLLALVTAALGIVNTLVMSVTERRREIGVIKSLGADESEIRWLFVGESAIIGCAGSLVGVLLGWLGTRVVRLVMQAIMSREGMFTYEPFAFPAWLVLLAMAFGIGMSVLAGTYPAARAARVDPVAALRSE